MDLKNTQLQQTFGNLVTVGTSAGTPTLGQIENGDGTPLTQITLAGGSAAAPSYSFTGDVDTGLFSSGADAIGLVTGGTNRLAIDSSGRVGIGVTSPTVTLDVAGDVKASKNQNATSSFTFQNTDTTGTSVRTHLKTIAGNRSIRLEAIHNDFSYIVGSSAKMYFQTNGGSNNPLLLDGNNATFAGAVSKGSGSFKIDHPLESKKDTHHLVHSFVESPQANNIYRGSVTLSDGQATINLDEVSTMTEGTFVALNTSIHVYTSNESDWDAVKGSVSDNVLTIECQNSASNAIVNWLVIGERQDQHMIDTEWTDENGKVIVEPLK